MSKKAKFSPYDELGLGPNASPEEVHTAYRRKAAKAHPDAGGSRDKFALVVLAKDVLSDAKRRAKFDRFGQIDESDGEPDSIESDARQEIAKVVNMIINTEAIPVKGLGTVNPEQVDLVDIIRDNLKGELDATRVEAAKAERHMKRAEKLEKKFKRRAKGANLLSAFARSRANQESLRIALFNQKIAVFERAIAILDDYLFEADPLHVQMTVSSGGVFGGFGSFGGGTSA